MRKRKLNKYQRRNLQMEKIKRAQSGKGLYIYRNNTSGDLSLPKPDVDGKTRVSPGDTWKGDDYFMFMLKSHEARLVETLSAEEMENKMEEKLILEQPEQVTPEGVVEQVVSDELLTEETPTKDEGKTVLLTEDPMDGVEILLD